jgi:hypothetical protein
MFYGLFNAVLNIWKCTASDEKMINECLIGKNVNSGGGGLLRGTILAFP